MQITNYPWLKSYPEGIKWDAPLELFPLYKLLDDAASHFPENTLVDFMGKKTSYKEINRLVLNTAKGLQQQGVIKGTKVGLLLPNCPLFIIAYFAILKLGAIVVNYNPLYSLRELQYQVEDSETTVMITMDLKTLCHKASTLLHTSILEKMIVGSLESMLPFPQNKLFRFKEGHTLAEIKPDPKIILFSELIQNNGLENPAVIDPCQDVAVLQYTGGTTGIPKGALLTHANLYSNVMQTSLWMYSLTEGQEKILAVLPLFHVFAMTAIMNLGIKKAACLVLHPRFHSSEVIKDIRQKKITILPGVPTLFSALINEPGVKTQDFASLKLGFSGGAPLPATIRQAFETISGCRLLEGYGLTESGPVAAIQPVTATHTGKEGSVGLALPDTVIEICGLDAPNTLLPCNEIGEICISGPQVMTGYLHQKEETENVLTGGRLHTGDIGYLDKDGYLFVVDRVKEMIIAGGYKIYPRIVEEAIYMHTSVKEVAVIGIEDGYRGQTVKAFIVCKTGHHVTADILHEFLKPKLAIFEIPTVLECVESLPKTIIGKVAKKELKGK